MDSILTPSSIVTGAKCASWRELALLSTEILVREGHASPDYGPAVIESIERFGPYVIIAPGVALFHAAPGPYVFEPAISLVTLVDPVFFTEYANQPVDVAFAFCAVDADSHLSMIQSLVRVLQDDRFLRSARAQAGPGEIARFADSILQGGRNEAR